jgi:hypothetical protein
MWRDGNCGTVMICCGSGSGSYLIKVLASVPDPDDPGNIKHINLYKILPFECQKFQYFPESVGSGSTKAKSFGSCGSGSTTLISIFQAGIRRHSGAYYKSKNVAFAYLYRVQQLGHL